MLTRDLFSPSHQVSSDILDFMFKPDHGLALQMLKVEIGGDTDATEGAEPSHMHSATDPGDYERGYEWWLMKEAKKRNPDIKLYGLPWGWPGWLDPAATAASPATNPFADANVTANYTLAWLLGAKRVHGLDIDYVGQWNERDAPQDYNDALRRVVGASPELANATTVLNRLPHYPGTANTPDAKGCTQYPWNTTDGSRWVDEEGSIYDGRSARCLARCVNRAYVSDCHTAVFQWHLVSSRHGRLYSCTLHGTLAPPPLANLHSPLAHVAAPPNRSPRSTTTSPGRAAGSPSPTSPGAAPTKSPPPPGPSRTPRSSPQWGGGTPHTAMGCIS